MTLRRLTDRYAVAPQLAPEDVPGLKAAGIDVVICNRPDEEAPAGHDSASLRRAVEAAGMVFVDNPVTHPTMTPDRIDRQAEAMERGSTLAYCASGMRSSVLWALAERARGARSTDEVISAARQAGYDHEPLRARYDVMGGDRAQA